MSRPPRARPAHRLPPAARAPLGAARRLALALLAAALLTACGPDAPAEPPAADAAPVGPSVILVSLDTLRPDHMGLYGYARDTTPYLERLAAECVVFERALAPVPWTLPSHLTMLTGLHPREHGVLDGDRALSAEIPLLAERFAAAGWRTAGVHNQGWIHPRHGFDRGFERFVEHESAEQALDELDRLGAELAAEPDAPFFVFAHFFDAHSRDVSDPEGTFYEPPPPFDTLYDPDAPAHVRALDGHRRWHLTRDFTPADNAALIALYDGGVRYLDHVLERWLEDWRARGLLDDTVLLITADHGEALNQRGMLRGHGGFYQEGLRIPFVLRFADGRRAGERDVRPVSLVDVTPTLLSLAGLPVPEQLAGHALDGALPADRVLLAERDTWRSLVRWPDKLVVTGEQASLVDLEQDPLEQAPRLLDEAQRRRVSRELLDALREQEAGRPRRFPAPQRIEAVGGADLEALQALGYLDEGEDDG